MNVGRTGLQSVACKPVGPYT